MRVLVVDDSVLMRNILKDFFVRHEFDVVGEASNGRVAIEMNERLQPDLITMDFDMPVMNGIEATAEIMQRRAVPVVLVSGEVTDTVRFSAFKAGAADVIEKPELDRFYDANFTDALIGRLRGVISEPAASRPGATRPAPGHPVAAPRSAPERVSERVPAGGVDLVVIGASTGGPVAVKTVLSALPSDFPVGIAVVQHIEARFADGYARWLDGECALSVRLATTAEPLTGGTVIVAPGDEPLLIHNGRILLDNGPKVGNHRPAVNRLFESAATSYGARLVGVLLTGMGRDGAAGCVAIRERGGFTIVQDEATSFIYGMPKAATELGGASVIKPLGEIAALLQEVASRG
ncbi:MAG: chemotaxis-specific protein-glutamate methyltransferase CheB [Spirochaeta sp.]|jgi:two-component system chemotaxis response regulator CheB|nr:chemotaxis-specific protein-glutamate methyltransferase CheB [Spirochaeta sp.]